MVSAPAAPSSVLSAALPVMLLSSVLPVPLMAPLPVSTSASRLAASVQVRPDCTVSVPWPTASISTSVAAAMT